MEGLFQQLPGIGHSRRIFDPCYLVSTKSSKERKPHSYSSRFFEQCHHCKCLSKIHENRSLLPWPSFSFDLLRVPSFSFDQFLCSLFCNEVRSNLGKKMKMETQLRGKDARIDHVIPFFFPIKMD